MKLLVVFLIVIILVIFCLPRKCKKSLELEEDILDLALDARNKIIWQENIEKNQGGEKYGNGS